MLIKVNRQKILFTTNLNGRSGMLGSIPNLLNIPSSQTSPLCCGPPEWGQDIYFFWVSFSTFKERVCYQLYPQPFRNCTSQLVQPIGNTSSVNLAMLGTADPCSKVPWSSDYSRAQLWNCLQTSRRGKHPRRKPTSSLGDLTQESFIAVTRKSIKKC